MFTTVAGGRVFEYDYCIGMQGVGAAAGRGFPVPVDFSLVNGLLYVMCRGAAEVAGQRVSITSIDHELINVFGSHGSGDGQFSWPTSIDLDKEGNIYTADEWLTRITAFDNSGKFLHKWGENGDGDGQLNRPSGIAFDKEDNLYVVDSLNNRIQVFTKHGKLLHKWGSLGNEDGQFDMPWGIRIDQSGNVFVADWRNSRVQKFTPDGKFLMKFEEDDAGVGEIFRPTSVAVDSEGDVYITDWGKNRLQVYAPDGDFVTSLYGDAEEPSAWAKEYIDVNPDYIQVRRRMNAKEEEKVFLRPIAVEIDDQDRIFVLENGRHRVQVYNKDKNFLEAQLNL
jgi:sugar lactone lactonase YvrE